MIPIVIDTGVLVAGVFWRNEPHRCVKAWLLGLFALAVSEAIVDEYERVLRTVAEEERFDTDVDSWLSTIRRASIWVTPDPLDRSVCRDPKDDMFLEVALAARARWVIARDADLTVLEKPFGLEIVTPRQFLARLPRTTRRQLD